jgi:hypothetical protein
MFAWFSRLRDWIARWWRSGYTGPPTTIEYRESGKVVSGKPSCAVGLHLVVETKTGARMVSAGEAVDRGQFWKTWSYLGGQAKFCDEDGEPWMPE